MNDLRAPVEDDLRASIEALLGAWEPVPLSPRDRRARASLVAALKALERGASADEALAAARLVTV